MFKAKLVLILPLSVLLSVCLNAQSANKHEDSLKASRPISGTRAKAWTIATDDTKLTVGVTTTDQLCVYELSNPGAGWNWTTEPSVFDLMSNASVDGKNQEVQWKYMDGIMDKTNGQKVTIRFVCEQLAMELTSVWHARPGRGPVHHTMSIANRSSRPITISEQPTMHLCLEGNDYPLAPGATAKNLTMWSFHTEGFRGDTKGVYRNDLVKPFFHRIKTEPNGEPNGNFIPYVVFDSGGEQGVYVGIEWSYCQIAVAAEDQDKHGTVHVHGGEYDGFRIDIAPGENYEVPPGFVGAYRGDLDAAGNSLRKYLFRYNMPEVLRKDATYPKVQWNAFMATGDKFESWNCVERKYYPLVDIMAQLGFEEVMIDVGWWKGETRAPEPEADPVDWPSGMAKAAEYAHQAGIRFGLYWNKGEEMATSEGRERRIAHIKRLYDDYKADMWRSDNTAGRVVSASYQSVKGFYEMLEQLYRELPNFQWENCSSGGQIKDFGAMKYAVKIFNCDAYSELHNRKAFYGTSFMFPPIQIEGHLSNSFTGPLKGDLKYAFRSCSMGAPEWILDPAKWTDKQKQEIRKAVETYKTRIRPLVRNADLYHILPRPDGQNWDGIQYYDPATGKGVGYLFKPATGTDIMIIKFRGIEPKTIYRVTFEDGTNPTVEKTGEELTRGIEIALRGAPVSELVFLDAIHDVE